VAEQATGTVDGTGTAGALAYDPGHMEHNPGRPISWTGSMATVAGFVIGGISFPIADPGPNWVVFWIGVAVSIIGLFIMLFGKTFSEDWY
jgi:hypothetical protein